MADTYTDEMVLEELPPHMQRDVEEDTGPPATSAEIQKYICKLVQRQFEESKEKMGDEHDKIRDALSMDSGATMRVNLKTGQSDIHIPAIRVNIQTIQYNQTQGLFPGKDHFEYEPDGEEDEVGAQWMTHLVRMQNDKSGFQREIRRRTLFDINAFGTGWVRAYWDKQVGQRKMRRHMLLPVGDGRMMQVEQEVVEDVLLYEGPRIRTIHPLQIFPSDLDVEEINDLRWITETGVVDYDTIHEMRQRRTVVPRDGVDVDEEVGLYNAESCAKLLENAPPASTERHGAGDEVDNPLNANDAPEHGASGHQWKEHWVRLNLGRELGFTQDYKNAKSRQEFSIEEVMAFLDDFKLRPEDMEYGGWWVINTADDKVLLRIERNPYPFDELPYHKSEFFKNRGRLTGDGMYAVAGGLQISLDATTSLGMDASRIAVAPPVGVDKSALDASEEDPAEAIERATSEANGVLILEPGRSLSDALQQWVMNPQTIMEARETERHKLGLIEDITGADANLKGRKRESGRISATQWSSQETNAANRIIWANICVEEDIIEPVLNQFYLLNQRFLDTPQTISIGGDDGGTPQQATIEPEWLQGKMKAKANGTSELTNKMTRSQILMNLSASPLAAVYRLRELGKANLDELRLSGNKSKMLKSERELRIERLIGSGMLPPEMAMQLLNELDEEGGTADMAGPAGGQQASPQPVLGNAAAQMRMTLGG